MTEYVEKMSELRQNNQKVSELPLDFDQLALNEPNKESILDRYKTELLHIDLPWRYLYCLECQKHKISCTCQEFLKSESCRALKSQYGGHMDLDRERTEK